MGVGVLALDFDCVVWRVQVLEGAEGELSDDDSWMQHYLCCDGHSVVVDAFFHGCW